MTIGIDGNEANVSRLVGVSVYAHQLLMRFQALKRPDLQFVIYLKEPPLPHMPEANASFRYRIIKPKKFWTQIGLPIDLFTHFPRPDVFFSPNHYAPRLSPVPSVIAIHDLAYLFFPDHFLKKDLYQLINWTKYSVNQAAHVLAVSEKTRDDIIKLYNVKPEAVTAIRLGIKQNTSMNTSITIGQLEKKYGFSSPYIFYLGTIQPRKNLIRLMDAFAILSKKHTNLQLVIVGRKGWMYEPILARPQELGIAEKVHFLDFAPDDEARVLYANAACFVLPSLYEGFGLPVLEAMQAGCPVVTSNVSSLPEIGGDAALYCNPEDVDDIAAQIEKVITDSALRKVMVAKGLEQVKKFDWDKTAAETLAVLEKVGKKK